MEEKNKTVEFNRLFNLSHGMTVEPQAEPSRIERACSLCGGELVEENTDSDFIYLDMDGEHETCRPCVYDYYEKLLSE